jgi:hypothetical protein
MDAGRYRILMHALERIQTQVEIARIELGTDDTDEEAKREFRALSRQAEITVLAVDYVNGMPPPWKHAPVHTGSRSSTCPACRLDAVRREHG